jgi:hypothetical protein
MTANDELEVDVEGGNKSKWEKVRTPDETTGRWSPILNPEPPEHDAKRQTHSTLHNLFSGSSFVKET